MTKRIMVVDDNAELRSLISDLLRIEGYAVSEAADGVDAMDVYFQSGPDAVLLDIQMPRQGGLETMKALHVHAPNLPVVFLSGVSDTTILSEVMKWGAFDFIPKYPLDIERMLSSLRHALGAAG